MTNTTIALFEEKQVRKIWHQWQWFFVVVDIIYVLTESIDSSAYRRKLKQRLKEEWNETVTNCHTLKLLAKDNKMRSFDIANTENIFRIIQSIPSPKAEPFKQRLAKVWYERIQEIENPELAQERMKKLYEQKWYPKAWIDKRLRGIAVRQELTDEWKQRWVKRSIDYAILTNEIAQATFGMTVNEYMDHKWLAKQNNLRDSMTDLELILTMLGEATTTSLHRKRDSKRFGELQKDANEWWTVAWKTRADIENRLWETVISKQNHLDITGKNKLK